MVQPKYGRSLSLGGKEKISPSLGRKARVKVNLGKRPRRETGVPGGKPKARLNLGVSLEEVILSLGKEPKFSQGPGRGLRADLNPGRNPRKRLSLGVKGKTGPGLGRKARAKASPGRKPRRETGVPGGKPKARLNLGINPEEAVLSPGKEPKVSQDSGRDLRVDLNPARKPADRKSTRL